MTRLDWTATGNRFYETGVDRGVLYVNGSGFAWPGLISVDEAPVRGAAKTFYLDGIKYINLSGNEDFAGTIAAYSSPPEFAPCDGSASIGNGLFATQQPRKPFDFCYRTQIGNDVDGVDHGYKLHLVYNALAAPSSRTNTSVGSSVTPGSYSWGITTIPEKGISVKPTAHFVIDSRSTPDKLLMDIEDILYGNDNAAPRIPSAAELLDIFAGYLPILLVPVDANAWQLMVTDDGVSNTFTQATIPVTSTDVLWLDNSAGDYAVPKLVTGA